VLEGRFRLVVTSSGLTSSARQARTESRRISRGTLCGALSRLGGRRNLPIAIPTDIQVVQYASSQTHRLSIRLMTDPNLVLLWATAKALGDTLVILGLALRGWSAGWRAPTWSIGRFSR
jgi:hypothetical protein